MLHRALEHKPAGVLELIAEVASKGQFYYDN